MSITKRILAVLAALVLLACLGAGGFLTYCALDYPRHVETQRIDLQVQVTPERVARGREIALLLCAKCHYDQRTGSLTGRRLLDTPKELGVFYASNITGDPATGIGRYSDGELAYLLRTGVERDGSFPGPFMAHPNMSDEDIRSVIAYLRSDDPLVRARRAPNHPSEPTLHDKILLHAVYRPFEYPSAPIEAPDPSDQVAYGRYLVNGVFECYTCHSADYARIDFRHPERSPGYLGGGTPMHDAAGNVVLSANLTFDKATGIGGWSEADFARAVREGFRPDRLPLRYPMEPYSTLTDQELDDIYAYLRTVPPIAHAMDRWKNVDRSAALAASEGERIYHKYLCYSCHGPMGVGACDARPAFRDFKDEAGVIAFLRDPARFRPGARMPGFAGVIHDDEYPPLAAFIQRLGAVPLPANER